jgi:hypothetical protein
MQWSLEDIYKKRVRGKIPPRKHLRVLGEAKLSLTLDDGTVKEVEVDEDRLEELDKAYDWVEGGRKESIKDLVSKDFVKKDGRLYYARRGPDGQYLPRDQWDEVDKKAALKMFDDIYSSCGDAADPAKCYQRLMTGVGTSSLIHVFRDFLTDPEAEKNWNPQATDTYAVELARLMMPHAGRGSDSVRKLEKFFSKENWSKHPNFDTSPRDGNLIKDFKKIEGFDVDQNVVKSLMSHSGVDERKRGVGMAELGMSLLFKNIGSAEGAGDLAVLGIGGPGEQRAGFEIKGHNAILGSQPEDHPIGWPALKKFGIVKGKVGKKDGILIKGADNGEDAEYLNNEFANALADIYTSIENKTLCLDGIDTTDKFKKEFKEVLFDTYGDVKGKDQMEVQFDKINWTDPVSISSRIGLINFIMYAAKEEFTHFLAHDFGAAKEKKTGGMKAGSARNQGGYVYVTGKPEEMAGQLLDHGKAYFEPITPSNVRPRISSHSPVKPDRTKTELELACKTGKLPSGAPVRPGATPEGVRKEFGSETDHPHPRISREMEFPRETKELKFDYKSASDEEWAKHIDKLSR